jgi:hypothetical protein
VLGFAGWYFFFRKPSRKVNPFVARGRRARR